MSFWSALTYDCALCCSEHYCLENWRAELLSSLAGDVLELGAGTGVNLKHYPACVRSLTLVEPDSFMRQKLNRKLAKHSISFRTEVLGTSAETIELSDASIDAVVGTLVLCSVSDVSQVLREIRRVLRPGGSLSLIEHVAAPAGTMRRRWQSWLEPTWAVVAGGCHLLRDPRLDIETAGFKPSFVTERELSGVPGFIKSAIIGTWTV